MKYWTGYLTAAIIGAITWALMQLAGKFTALVDMVYPYVTRTIQDMLATWSGSLDFCLWQLIAVAAAAVLIGTIVLMIVLRWNPVRWLGWVLAGGSALYLLHTLVFGLNYYAGPIADDVRLEVRAYSIEELADATAYYRDRANLLADRMNRDSSGDLDFADFETLAAQAADGFDTLVYEHSYPVFAGSTLPVKKLGWADMYSSMGITGFTMGLTGEAAVNPQIPDVTLPFTMCHEMAHRMSIAGERDANFAAFLAAHVNESNEFKYSAYFMAGGQSGQPRAAARYGRLQRILQLQALRARHQNRRHCQRHLPEGQRRRVRHRLLRRGLRPAGELALSGSGAARPDRRGKAL